MSEIEEYKCPNCGGGLNFDSKLQKVKCPYCDTEFNVSDVEDYNQEIKSDETDESNWTLNDNDTYSENEAQGIRVYVCKSCGGEIVADENTAASVCPYCDSPIVVSGSISGALRPEFIIPFKVDKKAAIEGLKAHLKGKKLLPKVFKDQNHLESIKGIYAPYWIFNSDAHAKIRYKATRVRRWSDSRNDHEEISYYSLIREGDISFENVPVDGSSKLDDSLMESLEPYDTREAVPFSTAYFAGYAADKYDVDVDQCKIRADERVKNSTQEAFRRTATGYTTVTYEGGNIKLSEGKVRYCMYPVWLLTTVWKGQRYTFAMNGQTGSFVGDLPIDKGIAIKIFLRTFLIVAIVVYALLTATQFL